jgi:hypothetical protein
MIGPAELRAKQKAERFDRPARTKGIPFSIPGPAAAGYRPTFGSSRRGSMLLGTKSQPGRHTAPVAVLILAEAMKAPARLAAKVDATPPRALHHSAAASSLS